jgi:UDP-3-O-[3-hydroxymyristoyl] glucosamine N-acyltransferase
VNVTALYAPVHLDVSSVVGEHCVLGYPKEARLRAEQQKPGSTLTGEPVRVGPGCLVANQVVIYEGVQIGTGCVIEDRVRIGYNSTIGERTRVGYGAYVCDRVRIGADACVAFAARWAAAFDQ